MTNIFIPEKIRVGFQNRKDTFTGKLGYVIYYDEKGKIRKETSWKNWCDSKIEALELDNEPRSGYVLNKGGQRYSDWGSSRAFIRVYDTRDFEFEISIHNLVGILMHSDVSKRDIVEECVFAWHGSDLVLLPVNSDDYRKAKKFTEKQTLKISTKELVKGYTYFMKKNDYKYIYMGYFEYSEKPSYYNDKNRYKGKKHVFYNINTKSFDIPNVSSIAGVADDNVNEDYSNLIESYLNSYHTLNFVGARLNGNSKKSLFIPHDGKFISIVNKHSYNYYSTYLINYINYFSDEHRDKVKLYAHWIDYIGYSYYYHKDANYIKYSFSRSVERINVPYHENQSISLLENKLPSYLINLVNHMIAKGYGETHITDDKLRRELLIEFGAKNIELFTADGKTMTFGDD